MLHTNRLRTGTGISTNEVVAGKHGGKKILCAPAALPAYNKLVSMSKHEKNYWATMIVKGINGLAAGRLHMENIFVDSKASLAYGNGYFQVVWPGARIVVKKVEEDQYIIQSILADLNYTQGQKNYNEPGLWKADKITDKRLVFKEDGRIDKQDGRVVAIADMAVDKPESVSRAVREDLGNVNGSINLGVKNTGFDLHYTPGESGLVGLKKAKDALADTKDRKIARSAMLLANTMYHARNINSVVWCSDWGGSVVLTRALEILGTEGIKLDKHALFLNRPTCKPSKVFQAAARVEIAPLADKGGKKVGLRLDELRGHYMIVDRASTLSKKAGVGLVAGASAGFGLHAGATILGATGFWAIAAGVVGAAGGLHTMTAAISSGKDMLKKKQYK